MRPRQARPLLTIPTPRRSRTPRRHQRRAMLRRTQPRRPRAHRGCQRRTTMTETPMVTVHEVTKTYGSGSGKVTALDAVSFEVGRGKLVALVGRSGSGKTTL